MVMSTIGMTEDPAMIQEDEEVLMQSPGTSCCGATTQRSGQIFHSRHRKR